MFPLKNLSPQILRISRIAAVLLLIMTVIWLSHQHELLAMLTSVDRLQAWISGFGLLSYLVYLAIYVLACVLMIPGSALTIGAGILFGPVKGGVLALLGSTAGASMAFLVARFLLRDTLVRRFGTHPVFRKIDDGVTQNGLSFLILTRLVPLFPFNVQNFAYGLTGLRLIPYAVITLFTMAPITFIFAYTAGDVAANGVSSALLVKLAVAGVLLSALSLLPRYIAQKRGISLDGLQNDDA